MEASGLEWENLALYSGRPPVHIPPSTLHDAAGFRPNSGALIYPEPIIGLRLGQQNEYGDYAFPPTPTTSTCTTLLISSSIPTPTKRSRASYHNMQSPCCQVEGCNLDLKLAKDYHRRHRICDTHSKSPKVIVAGMERRFCQQCSRFHDLSEFDDKKRSCRRRLSDHNARRRRVQPESVQLSSPGLAPVLYDQRRQNVLLNGLPVSLPNSRWENASTSMSRHGVIRHSNPRGVDGTLNFSSDDVVFHNLHMDPQRSNPRSILDQCVHVASTNSPTALEMISAPLSSVIQHVEHERRRIGADGGDREWKLQSVDEAFGAGSVTLFDAVSYQLQQH